jgi:hypothetical protein
MQSAAIHCRNSFVSKARPGPGNGEDRSKTWDIFLTTHKTHKLIYLWSSRHGDTFAASAAPKHLRTPSTWDTPSHFAERNGSPVQFSKLSPTCLPTYLPILMDPQHLSWIANHITSHRPLRRSTRLLESGRQSRLRDASMPKFALSSSEDGLWQLKHRKIARRAHRENLAVAIQETLLIRSRRSHRQAL